MVKTVDGPFCILLNPARDEWRLLESLLGDVTHLRFAASEAELRNLAGEVFPEVQKLIVVCMNEEVRDYDALMLARRIRGEKGVPVIITSQKSFVRTWAELGIHFVTHDKLATTAESLLAA